jgi:hypothetical protein
MPKFFVPQPSFLGSAFSRTAFSRAIKHSALLFLLGACSSLAQVAYPNLEVHISGLPALKARTKDPSDVLKTSLDTIVNNPEICCGKDSGLVDSVERADPTSLKDVAAKLQGRQLMGDGRPIMVTASYIAPDEIGADALINTLQAKQALLMEWNSHIYVLYGVTYRKDYDPNGAMLDTILTLLLIDTRYADSRREIVFDRQTDDWSKVQGVLLVKVTGP